jgi:hypothetical protein
MERLREIWENLGTGDAIEMQIFVLFGGIIVLMVLVFFIGRGLFQKPPDKPVRMDRKPTKNWKSFCKTE